MSWREDAACRGMNPAIFFPDRGEPTTEAKAVCRRCPVRSECLDYSLVQREAYGVWGGTTRQTREAIAGVAMSRSLTRTVPA